MAELVNIAGDGLPLYLWGKSARPGQTAWDVGLERARGGLGGFAFQHTVVREVEGQVAACLVGYPSSESSKSTGEEIPAPLVPLVELGGMVTATWYINILATFPEFRRRGFAKALLGIAEARARGSENTRISLITSDANVGARKLYEGSGFVEQARRGIVKEDWEHSGREWILFVKDL